MHILVIGGGYLGIGVCEYLLLKEYKVTLFSRRAVFFPGAELFGSITGDIRDQSGIKNIIKLKPDAIIYTVSLDQQSSENSVSMSLDINIKPLWVLLESLIDFDCNFLYLSTIQVYGHLNNTVKESDIPSPLNHYALTHLMAENIIRRYTQFDKRYFSVRLSNGYGPPVLFNSNCWWLVVNDLCRSAHAKQEIKLRSDGIALRNFIHVQDIYKAIQHILDHSVDAPHKIYNLAGKSTHTILEISAIIAKTYEKLYRQKLAVYIQGERRDIDQVVTEDKSNRFSIDCSRLSDIGFAQSISLESGILNFFKYFEGKLN